MQKYSFSLSNSLKFVVLTLTVSVVVFVVVAFHPARVVNAAKKLLTPIRLTSALTLSAAAPQATTCATPTLTRTLQITLDAGAEHYAVPGDFNGNGLQDLVVYTSAGKMYTLLGSGTGDFFTSITAILPTGGPRLQIGTGDFNGDGRLDVITLSTARLEIYLNNHPGPIGLSNFYNINASGFQLGDFNKDGKTDIVVTLRCCPDGVALYLSNANGFTVSNPAWGAARMSAVADFNSDGNLDILTSDIYYPSSQVRLGNGRGQFTNGEYLYYDVQVFYFAVTDFNKDGKADVLGYTAQNRIGQDVANSRKLIVLTGDGAGRFTASYPTSPLDAIRADSVAADFTGDGFPDIATRATDIFANNGAGGLCAVSPLVNANVNRVSAADFNGDGKADLVRQATSLEIWTSSSGTINTPPKFETIVSLVSLDKGYENNAAFARISDNETPAGSLTVSFTSIPTGLAITGLTNDNGNLRATFLPNCSMASGNYIVGLRVTDANGASTTGNLNITIRTNAVLTIGQYPTTTLTPGTSQIRMIPDLPPSRDGQFTSSLTMRVSSPDFPGTLIMEGVTIAVSNATKPGSYTVNVSASDNCGLTASTSFKLIVQDPAAACGTVKFQATGTYYSPGDPDELALGDFNEDGRPDIVSSNRAAYEVSLLLNLGNGRYTPYGSYRLKSNNDGSGPENIEVADFNRDGHQDVAVAHNTPNQTLNGTVTILLGDGRGNLTKAGDFSLGAGIVAKHIVAADFNNDGRTDVAVVSISTNNFYLLLGKGDGTLLPAIRYDIRPNVTSPISPYIVEAGDFNRDGKADLAIGVYDFVFNSGVIIKLGDGAGGFGEAKFFNMGISSGAQGLALADFNNDGNLDVVAGNNISRVAVMLGDGIGNLGAWNFFAIGARGDRLLFSLAAADFNKDGLMDLAASGANEGTDILLGDGKGGFCAVVRPFGIATRRVVTGDLNGDGVADLVVSRPPESPFVAAVSVWLNNGTGTQNLPPKLDTIAELTIDNGYERRVMLGTALDPEGGALSVTTASIPAGLTFSVFDIQDTNGTLIANLSTDCTIKGGAYVVQLKATDAGGVSTTANVKIIVRENAPMTAPIYQDVVITAFNTQATVQPVILQTKNGQATMDDSNLQFSASAADFPGKIQMNGSRPFISEATKPGNYIVVVTARERCGLSASTKFNLIVQSPDACPAPSFGSSSKYAVGRTPRAIALGDFNNDGKADMLVGNLGKGERPNEGDVSLLLNNGGGGFGAATNFQYRDDGSEESRSVAVGDFNNDGNLDAVIGNAGFTAPGAFGSVILMLGNGKGNLTKSAEISLGENSVGAQLAVGDFNKDGRLDVAVINTIGGGFVFVLLGDGAGGFATVKKLAVGFPPRSPFTIATGDFNKDNNLDIVVADDYALTLSLGDGQGNFPAPRLFFQGLGETPLAIVVADFNRDNNPDVATLNQRSRIVIKLGDGKGDFPQTTAFQLDELYGQVGFGLVAADFDGDGIIDLAATSNNVVVTLTGDGSGGFCTATKQAMSFSGIGIVAGDLNGDGLADLALTDLGQNAAYVVLNTTRKPSGCESPVFNPALNYAANNRPYGLASGDFNGDGKVDLATTNLWDNTVTVLLADANGFTKQTPITVGVLPNYIAARDLNGDNKLDLAVVNRGSDAITILLGNGDGTFAKKGDYPVGNKSTGVAVGDFNKDGKLDLILPNDGLGNAVVLDGNGDGSFGLLRYVFAGNSPQPGVVADFNKDGNADVAFPQYFSGEVAILFGNGNGQFQSPIYVGNLGGTGVEAIALGDVNGDGNVDVAVTNTTTNQVFTIISDGRGGFTRGGGFATLSDYPASIVIADFTSDGIADIAVGGYNNNRVHIFKGLGNGFDNNAPLVLMVGNDPLSLLTNDFNGDGKPDLAVANNGSGTVSVLLNGCGN